MCTIRAGITQPRMIHRRPIHHAVIVTVQGSNKPVVSCSSCHLRSSAHAFPCGRCKMFREHLKEKRGEETLAR